MKSSTSYLPMLGLFSIFLVVSTLQLGKSRTTLDVIQKQKSSEIHQLPMSEKHQQNQIPRSRGDLQPMLMKPAIPIDQELRQGSGLDSLTLNLVQF